MSDTFTYITRPIPSGLGITTQPKYRGEKTTAEIIAAVAAETGKSAADVEAILRAFFGQVIDLTTEAWKIEAIFGLVGFQCGSGGSVPVGSPESWDFETMDIALRGYYGEAGRQRAQAAFSAEKVGEQNRVAPVFVEVYDSDTKSPNHYVAGKGLTLIMGNRRMKFDPGAGGLVRFRKSDGTYVNASNYPYIKGTTVVCTVPAGLTGSLEVEITIEINGGLRTGTYAFPIT
jgi:hypothetical protein